MQSLLPILLSWASNLSGYPMPEQSPEIRYLAGEREAYRVQNDYILEAQASFAVIRPAPTSCNYAAVAAGDAVVSAVADRSAHTAGR